MKVLHLMADGSSAGGAQHLLGLCQAQTNLGLKPIVATATASPLSQDLEERKVPVLSLDIMGFRLNPESLLELSSLVEREQPNLVHAHGTRAAFYASFFARRWQLHAPLIYTIHGLGLRQQCHPLKRAALWLAEYMACKKCEEIISVAKDDIQLLRAQRFLRPDRGVYIPNALTEDRFKNLSEKAEEKPPYWPKVKFTLGTVARLVPQKALHIAIEAVAKMPDTALLIAGDGPLRTELEAFAQKLQAPVIFLGEVKDVENFLPHLDLFVLSSRWEGEPIALLEAMAAGLAIAATDNSGARELLEQSRSGHLVPVDDARALGDCIMHLAQQDEERKLLGENGKKWVTKRTYEQQARAVSEVYRNALKVS